MVYTVDIGKPVWYSFVGVHGVVISTLVVISYKLSESNLRNVPIHVTRFVT